MSAAAAHPQESQHIPDPLRLLRTCARAATGHGAGPLPPQGGGQPGHQGARSGDFYCQAYIACTLYASGHAVTQPRSHAAMQPRSHAATQQRSHATKPRHAAMQPRCHAAMQSGSLAAMPRSKPRSRHPRSMQPVGDPLKAAFCLLPASPGVQHRPLWLVCKSQGRKAESPSVYCVVSTPQWGLVRPPSQLHKA